MKKILALALAAVGALWAVKKSRQTASTDVWAGATDKV